jgi:catechol 2,3-dioxygenase-like lactoylglutathione lyase family enzyme
MRSILILAAAAAPLFAQLAAPNDAGVSLGHIHMMVTNPEEHKKLWVGLLGAEVTHAGSLEMYKLPGIFIIAGKARGAVEGSDGSTIDHFGFLVPSYSDMKAKLTALNLTVANENPANKQVTVNFPDKIKVEFTEDPNVKGPTMHHIHLASPNQEKLRAWYVKMFAAKPGIRGQFLAAFVPGGEVDTRPAQQPPAPSKGRALDHIGFEVKNLEAFCKKLQADGVTLDMPYREMPQLAGLKIAFLTDPEGTRIELTEGLAGH